ncbi:MAG TPA: hypothetical protein VFZ04_22990, partial [Longimicrobiales bacterium]
LMRDGLVVFVGTAGDVVSVARNASRAAEQALAIPEASVEQLRRSLEDLRQNAATAVSTATATANSRRIVMNSAYSARNTAWSRYAALRPIPPGPKAQALAAYHVANGTYLQRAAAYTASMASVAAFQRVYNAIPPVDQNIALIRAEAAIAQLRQQLRTAQANLAETERRLAALEAALARGEQLLVIDRAEFHGGLQSAMNGEAIRWGITGSFAGEPFEVNETMDFSNVGAGSARLLQTLLQK